MAAAFIPAAAGAAGGAAAAGTFASILPIISAASTGISILTQIQGQKQQVAAAQAQAKAQQVAYDYQAAQLLQNKKLEEAAAQQQAIAKKEQGRRLQSEAIARAIAGGLMPDPGVLEEIAEETYVQASQAQYGGRVRGAGLQARADAAELSGNIAVANAPQYSGISALSTIAGAVNSSPFVTAGFQSFGTNLRYAPPTTGYR